MSEREANKEVAAKMKTARHAKEKDCLLRRLSGQRCSSDSDLTDDSTSRSNDDAPPHVDAYMEEGHSRIDNRKGEGPERKW